MRHAFTQSGASPSKSREYLDWRQHHLEHPIPHRTHLPKGTQHGVLSLDQLQRVWEHDVHLGTPDPSRLNCLGQTRYSDRHITPPRVPQGDCSGVNSMNLLPTSNATTHPIACLSPPNTLSRRW